MEPVAFRDQFGFSVKADGEGMTLNAMRFAVADIGRRRPCIGKTELAVRRHVGRLVVPPIVAYGATLIFEATN